MSIACSVLDLEVNDPRTVPEWKKSFYIKYTPTDHAGEHRRQEACELSHRRANVACNEQRISCGRASYSSAAGAPQVSPCEADRACDLPVERTRGWGRKKTAAIRRGFSEALGGVYADR